MFALCDCNNFYASCERLFRPDLASRPVAVLSNNDGCVIARSSEVKALGVPMGAPYFKEEGRFRHFGVEVFSSNYPLYEEISRRVTETLRSMVPDVEIYSIDEAFLHVDTLPPAMADPGGFCREIRERVLRWTGIPVSIGTGSTKTLAKAANRIAKRDPACDGVFVMPDGKGADVHLGSIDIGDVWGVGFRNAPKFRRLGIRTAKDLKYTDEEWLKQRFTIGEARSSRELNGRICFPFAETPKPRKSIRVSRSFGEPVTDVHTLREAVSSFAFSAAETLRGEGSAASKLHLFITTNPFGREPRYANAASFRFDVPTCRNTEITGRALACLERVYSGGYAYKKAGVILTDLVDASNVQRHLYSVERDRREETLMKTIDRLNLELGRGAIFTASMGIEGRRSWGMRRGHVSPRYTTHWDELPAVLPPGEAPKQ
jgi:DNA polymerase V